jgi:dUTP pyrophosphatase
VIELRFLRLDPAASLPAPRHEGDAGLDLASVEEVVLAPGERALVGVGLAVEIPPGHCGLVIPRSGLAARHGITILNAPGLVDAGYRGEMKVALLNTDRHEPFAIAVGDRIAQLVIVAIPDVRPVAVDALGDSARGAAGFGSTGRR